MNCAWIIEVLPRYVINISFVWIDIEKTYDCSFDSVEVKAKKYNYFCDFQRVLLFQIINSDDSDGNVLGKFCGNTIPVNNSIVSDSNLVVIRFHSDKSKNYRGFQLNYTMIKPSNF